MKVTLTFEVEKKDIKNFADSIAKAVGEHIKEMIPPNEEIAEIMEELKEEVKK